MQRSSSAVWCASESPSVGRRRSPSVDIAGAGCGRGDVDRWVAMISDELHAEDPPELPAARALPKSATARASSSPPNDSAIVEVTVEFGRTLTDETAHTLVTGALLRLDQLAAEPLDVVVAGRPVARGELIVVDGKLGVRIVEVLLMLLTWLVSGAATSAAEERPRERMTPRPFAVEAESETETEFAKPFDAPFAPTLGVRSAVESSRYQKTNVPDKTGKSAQQATAGNVPDPLLPKVERTPVPITPPTSARPTNFAKSADDRNGVATVSRSGWGSTLWPLVIVIALIGFGARWLKLHSPATARGLPSDAFDVLGRKAIDQRTSVVIARCGSRILVLSLSPQGLQTLAEITDPVEIDCLAGLCRTTQRDQGLSETFRAMLQRQKTSFWSQIQQKTKQWNPNFMILNSKHSTDRKSVLRNIAAKKLSC